MLEAGPIDNVDKVPVATVRLEGGELRVEAIRRSGGSAYRDRGAGLRRPRGAPNREVVSVEQRLDERRSGPERPAALPPELTPADERRLVGGFMTERMRKWLDEPHPQLDGGTPRDAVTGERRAEVVRLLRGIENGAERARRRGEPYAKVAWLRDELGLGDELAA